LNADDLGGVEGDIVTGGVVFTDAGDELVGCEERGGGVGAIVGRMIQVPVKKRLPVLLVATVRNSKQDLLEGDM